ncbi:hypothetical protein [Pseudonocardia sediminis]|uniref:hypothetical protein n=1 Tax=Pseudonocardia sediminis TaxID=1397368 RepID=UPI0013EF343A|nr:hypothetical protein [Pseudonocardia sediminis]
MISAPTDVELGVGADAEVTRPTWTTSRQTTSASHATERAEPLKPRRVTPMFTAYYCL